jgi:hypothetical protein
MTLDNNNWLSDMGFQTVRARDLLARPLAIRNTLGVYMVLISAADKIFSDAGISGAEVLRSWRVDNYQLVYIGEGVAMRSRAMQHISGTIRDSSAREFLLSIQHASRALWCDEETTLIEMERRLSSFLIANAYIAFRSGGFVRDIEKDLIKRTGSPFNVTGNSKSAILPQLKVLREKFRGHLRATVQRHHRAAMPPSAWLLRANHFAGSPTQSTNPLS